MSTLAKADGRRPGQGVGVGPGTGTGTLKRRESFRPRMSLMVGMTMLRAETAPFGDDSMGGLREEEEYEDDVLGVGEVGYREVDVFE